ncbi:glycosyltransferase [Planctomycetota bacterium]
MKTKEYPIINADEIPCQEISDPAVLSKTPLVSVKMITYNHEPYIAQAIEGVLMQKTDFPIELVIGEDCSTDRTREIVFDYQKKHLDIIRVITPDKNVGANKNNKITIKACRGKYMAFCEGDDYWHHPKKLQMQVDYLEDHPEVGLVHSDVDRYNVETGVRMLSYHKKRRLLYKHKKILNGMIVNEYIVETCTAVVRKEMYDEIRRTCVYEFSEKFLMGDVQTWMEIAYRSKVKYIDESLATRNLLPESACHSKDIDKRIRFSRSARAVALHYADKYGGKDYMELKKWILERSNKLLIRTACHVGNPELAREILNNSRKYDVPLDPVGYVCFFGAQKNIVSWPARALIWLSWRCRRLLARVKWLRALRVRMRK